jgi:hypothetical protein
LFPNKAQPKIKKWRKGMSKKNNQWREGDSQFHFNSRGLDDPTLSSDVRCGQNCDKCEFACEVRPWMALASKECWGEDCLSPDGLADGDTRDPLRNAIPLEDMVACDMQGNVIDGDNNYEDSLSLDDDEPDWPDHLEPPYQPLYMIREEPAPFIMREIYEEPELVDQLSDAILEHPLDKPKVPKDHSDDRGYSRRRGHDTYKDRRLLGRGQLRRLEAE